MTQTNDETPSAGKRNTGLNGRAILHALKRRPITLTAVVLLAVAAGASVWFLLPLPKTSVDVAFHISGQAPSLLDATAESRVDLSSYRQTQMILVKRRQTLLAVLKQPAVQNLSVVQQQPDPLVWLEKSLKIDSRGGEIMRVSLEGDNADELKVILEVLSKVYLAEVEDRDTGVRRRRMAKLEETSRGYLAEIERFRKRIDTIAIALGSKDGETLTLFDSLLRDDLRNATRELGLVREQLQRAELDLAAATNPPGAGDKAPGLILPWGFEKILAERATVVVSPSQVEEELQRDSGLKDLENAVTQARQNLSATKALFNPGDTPPAVVKAEETLKAAELKRDKYRDELRVQLAATIRKQIELREQTRLGTLQAAIAGLKKQEAQSRAKVAEFQKKVENSNDYRVELADLKAQIANNEKHSTRMTDEVEKIKIELGGAPPRVTLSEEPAVVPGIVGSRRTKYSILALVAVLFAGFAGVVMWEQRAQRLTHPDDVTNALGIRLIGAVPVASSGPGSGGEPPPVLVEAIDATRMMLLHGAHDCDLRVLVVTSAVSGEGKTSLSGHLAISLARAGFRTLLVDGDLQAPTAQRVFGFPLAPGLCEVLKGETSSVVAVHSTGVPNLSVLTAGQWGLTTRQVLAGDGWRVVKEQLKSEFDFVVVDTSPLLLVSDALLLAREADGVVVSVLMGVSQLALVDEAIARLNTVRAKVTGVIANGVRSVAHEYTRRLESPVALTGNDPVPTARA